METRVARVLALTLAGMSGVILLACQGQTLDTARPDSARALGGTVAADPAALEHDDGQWVMPAKNYASTRFSGLDEINAQNVGRLGVSWTFSTGMVAGHEAAPLVVGSTMFIVTPFPNMVYAFDLSQAGAPMRWQYDPKPLGAAKGVACCDLVNRGAAYADGTLFFNTLDGRTIALDADTGRPKWITQLGDINKGETMTMAPLVVKGKVLVGNSGGEFGVRGWLVALEATSGAVAWRAYSTGPDRDVLIGPNFKPFYAGDRGNDLGITTWPGEGWRTGGGTVWGWISYDPELDLIFYGASNPGPWNPEQRPLERRPNRVHAAADIDANSCRDDGALGRKHRPDRRALSVVAIGHDGDVLEHERHRGRVEDLLLCRRLDRVPRKEDNCLVVDCLHERETNVV
jgi:lanthanide-dependent methanol dehydrogenase